MEIWTPDREDLVSVAAWFDPRKPLNSRVIFIKLLWNGQVRFIKHFDFYHQDKKDQTLLHYFSVADQMQHYRLRFDSEKLLWVLEGTYDRE